MEGLVTLTREGGQSVLVNVFQVATVRDRANDKLVIVTMANGQDFEVQESFEDVLAKLSPPPTLP